MTDKCEQQISLNFSQRFQDLDMRKRKNLKMTSHFCHKSKYLSQNHNQNVVWFLAGTCSTEPRQNLKENWKTIGINLLLCLLYFFLQSTIPYASPQTAILHFVIYKGNHLLSLPSYFLQPSTTGSLPIHCPSAPCLQTQKVNLRKRIDSSYQQLSWSSL